MRNRLKTALFYLILLFATYTLARLFLEERKLLQQIRSIDFIYFIPQFILAFLLGLLDTYVNKLMLQTFHIDLKFKEWFGLGCVNSLSNYLFPLKAGTMVKAIYLKKKYGFPITHNASIMLFSQFIFFEIIFFFSFLIFAFIRISKVTVIPHTDLLITVSFSIFLAGLLFALSITRIPLDRASQDHTSHRLFHLLRLFSQGLKILSTRYHLIIVVVISQAIVFSLQTLRLYFGYLAIKNPQPLFKTAIVNILYCIGSLVILTPGNIGIQEFILTLSSSLIGLTREEGFMTAAIIRAVALVLVMGLGIFYYLALDMNKVILTKELKE